MVEDLEEVIDGGPAVTSNYSAEISNGAEVSREANRKRNKGRRPKNKKDVVTHLTNQFINVKASETIAGDNVVAENKKRPYDTRFMGEKNFVEPEGIEEEPETSDSDDPDFEDSSQAGVQPSQTDDQSVHVEQAENVQSDVHVESDMHSGYVQQTENVPTPSNIASALSQPVISSSSLTQVNIQPQSCSQQTVIRSSQNSKTFVCPSTRMLMKSKSVAQKPKPMTRSNTSGRAQQGSMEGSNKKIFMN